MLLPAPGGAFTICVLCDMKLLRISSTDSTIGKSIFLKLNDKAEIFLVSCEIRVIMDEKGKIYQNLT